MTKLSPAQLEARRKGGLAVKPKPPPARCPRCGRGPFKNWHAWLGHKGLHGLADNHFGGDIKAAQTRLRENALATIDPYPENNAWPKYKPVSEMSSDELKDICPF